MKKTVTHSILALAIVAFSTGSCKKEPIDPNAGETLGCMDIDSPHFDATATLDDGSCESLYVTEYELSNYQDIDWDLLINVDADVYLKVKKQNAASWEFASNTINDVNPNAPQLWSAPEQFQLTNEFYTWELYDADLPPVDQDDFMASGTFNPVVDGVDGVVTSQSADGLTTVRIHYAQ
ncbi:MAG: hypothetical protein ACI837_001136, partial [Crocinitomicaceae bacterium]